MAAEANQCVINVDKNAAYPKALHMIRKGQVKGADKGDILGQIRLFGVVA